MTLPAVASICNAALGVLVGDPDPGAEPIFPMLLFEIRFAADPAGCLVAADSPSGQVSGALLSVSRGTLGWFGPLAVHPEAQHDGLGEELVATSLDTSQKRGVRLMGLETFAASSFHVAFYGKMSLRPSWTGISFRRSLRNVSTTVSADVSVDREVPDLELLYSGLDVVPREAAATTGCGAGHVLTTDDGIAILQIESTFQASDVGFVPSCAAATWEGFSRLIGESRAPHPRERQDEPLHENLRAELDDPPRSH